MQLLDAEINEDAGNYESLVARGLLAERTELRAFAVRAMALFTDAPFVSDKDDRQFLIEELVKFLSERTAVVIEEKTNRTLESIYWFQTSHPANLPDAHIQYDRGLSAEMEWAVSQQSAILNKPVGSLLNLPSMSDADLGKTVGVFFGFDELNNLDDEIDLIFLRVRELDEQLASAFASERRQMFATVGFHSPEF